ncbi:MAG: IS4 family transposase [Blastocatellia bacterium]|nr:IS4 family transposase [Blastocatellia bacterium]
MNIRDTAQDVKQWAAQQWGAAELKDKRRTKRAVTVGLQLAAQPAASLPEQMGCWKDLKAAYRLFNEPDVTQAALSLPHRQGTLHQARLSDGVVLFIQDGTELDFTHHPQVKGLGRLNTEKRHGLLVHSCLAWSETSGELGLAAQQVWRRGPKANPRTKSKRESSWRDTECDVWAKTLQELGPAPPRQSGVRWISVGDRASDIYGYFRQAEALGWEVVARAAHERIIETVAGERPYLMQWARQLPSQATKDVDLRGRDGRPARMAQLQVAWAQYLMPAPRDGKERGGPDLRVSVIRAWEAKAPDGVEPLEWVLITTLAVTDAQSALQVIEYYEKRWMIEEYHKCLKTGCAMEARQLETADGLEALLGFLSIIAVRLLQMREASRQQPEMPARQVIPPELLETVESYLKLPPGDLTMREFWRAVARLGGFLGRKRDGDPGWQTIWRGWQKLQDLAWQPSS